MTGRDGSSGRLVRGVDVASGSLGGTDFKVPTLILRPADTVSALIEGQNNPVGNATSCPDLVKLRITVNGRTTPIRPSLLDCIGLIVHPYVPGTTGYLR